MKKHRPLNLDMSRIHENQEINKRNAMQYMPMVITKLNVIELGFDYLKSLLDYNKDLSGYTEKLIENEIKIRRTEMEKSLLTGLNNLSTEVLLSLNSKTNRYPIDFENKIKSVISDKKGNRYLKSNKNRNKKNNGRVEIIIIIFIGICAVITNPDSEKHKEVIKTECYSLMQKSMNENVTESDSKPESTGQALGMRIGKPIIDRIVENIISSDNYVFFSTTKITLDGNPKVIGVGAFGNVFLNSSIDEALNEAFSKNKQDSSENK